MKLNAQEIGNESSVMSPSLRKFALTAHVTSSISWLGAVAGFLALAVAGLTSRDAQMVRAAYLAMELTAWFVIVPLAFASLLTGIIHSLGTTWGLFRHYWVLAKLLITIPSTILLLVHMKVVSRLAGAAAKTILFSADLHGLRIQMVADAGAALLVLLVATTLSVYKPQGRTPYGRLYPDSNSGTGVGPGRGSSTSTPRWVYMFGITGIVLLFVMHHLTVGGLGGHHH